MTAAEPSRRRTARFGALRHAVARLLRTPPHRALATIASGRWRPLLRGIHGVRLAVSRTWLRGQGLEIGAGPDPQPLPDGCTCRYYDLRTPDELRALFGRDAASMHDVRPIATAAADFPAGADFVIAHNVLEHCADPIGALQGWHDLLRDDGVVVLSLPDMAHCPDRLRAVATLEHLLLDHLLQRDERAFESREHLFSFVNGWNDAGAFAGKSKDEVARMAHGCATAAEQNDCHWHAFDEALGRRLIAATARLRGRRVEFLNVAAPQRAGAQKTTCDLIYVYRLRPRADGAGDAVDPDAAEVDAVLRRLADDLRRAQARIGAALGAAGPAER
ncbi:MAG: class I SAM-dependent methyltransferase [Planctomycetota bacterium]